MDFCTLHSEAMDHAERAVIARSRGDREQAHQHLLAALASELEATKIVVATGVPEPTRSILLNSAAHLAVDVGELRLAEKLVGTALAGDPPAEIAEELRAVFETIGFHRHLDLRGVRLQSNELQMVIVGDAVAPGMAASDEFVKRVDVLQRLVYRTSESDLHQPYRERGDPKQAIGRQLQMYISQPRAASFAVSLRIASLKGHAELPFAESSVVVDHLLDRLSMLENEQYEDLRVALPREEYFDNFVQLASELAPDGTLVKMVGFTADDGLGKERRLQLKRPLREDTKSEIFVPPAAPQRFHGRVYFINIKDEDHPIIRLETDDGSEFRLKADDAMLTKAVRYAAQRSRVVVTGIQTARTVLSVEDLKAARGRKPRKARATP